VPSRPLVRSALAYTAAGLAAACAISAVAAGFDPPYRPAAAADAQRRTASETWASSEMVEHLHLQRLESQILPETYSEIRLELRCSGCLPNEYVRLVMGPNILRGEAYIMVWEPLPPPLDADSAMHAAFTVQRLRTDSIRRAHTCMPSGWCRVERPEAVWRHLARTLDSLDAWEIGADTGYTRRPVAIGLGWGRIPAGLGSADSAQASRGCSDLAGQGLVIESLRGSTYRNAHFWCLENPITAEEKRAAAIESAAFRAIHPLYREPAG